MSDIQTTTTSPTNALINPQQGTTGNKIKPTVESTVYSLPPLEKEKGSLSDYAQSFSILGHMVVHPEDFNPTPTYSTNYDLMAHLSEIQKQYNLSSTDVDYLISKHPTSVEEVQNIVNSRQHYEQSNAKIANDPWYKQLVWGGAVQLLDAPIYMTPGIGSTSKIVTLAQAGKKMELMSSILKGETAIEEGIIGRGVSGAVLGAGYTGAMQYQGNPNVDYANTALTFGLLNMGTKIFSTLSKLPNEDFKAATTELGKPMDSTSELLHSDPTVEVDTKVKPTIPEGNGDGKFLDTTEKAIEPRIATNKLWDKLLGWLDSSVNIGHASKDNMVRKVMGSLSNASTAVYDNLGNIITSRKSAMDYVHIYSGDFNKLTTNLDDIFINAKKDGYTGNIETFYKEVGQDHKALEVAQRDYIYNNTNYNELKDTYNKQLKDIEKNNPDTKEGKVKKEELKKQAKEDFDKQVDALYKESHTYLEKEVYPTLKHPEANKKIIEHYRNKLELGKKLEVPELAGISKYKVYSPRKFDFSTIDKMNYEDLVNTIKQAIISEPKNKNKSISKENLHKIATDISTSLKNNAFTREYADYSYTVPKDLPVSSHLKNRKIELDDRALSNILDTNVHDITRGYNYWMNRQMAIRTTFPKLRGVATGDLLNTFQNEYIKPIDQSIATAKEINALNNVFKDVLGIHSMSKDGKSLAWKTSKIATNVNSLLMLGNTGTIALTEIPTALLANNTNKFFMQYFLPAVKDAQMLMMKGHTDNKIIQAALLSGKMHDLLGHTIQSRVADIEGSLGMTSWLENTLYKANSTVFKYNGLKAITAGLESAIFGSTCSDLIRMAESGLTKSDRLLISKWGLSEERAISIGKELLSKGEVKKGYVIDPKLELMEESLRQDLQVATNRAIESGVMQGDTLHVHNAFREANAFNKVALQFLKIPAIAHNMLLRRGLDGEIAGVTVSALASAGIYMTTQLLVSEAEYQAGIAKKKKWDVDDKDSMKKLAKTATGYMTSTGGLSNVVSGLAPLFGQSDFNRYDMKSLNPTFSTIQNLFDIVNTANKKGWNSEATYKKTQKVIPLGNTFFIRSALDNAFGE